MNHTVHGHSNHPTLIGRKCRIRNRQKRSEKQPHLVPYDVSDFLKFLSATARSPDSRLRKPDLRIEHDFKAPRQKTRPYSGIKLQEVALHHCRRTGTRGTSAHRTQTSALMNPPTLFCVWRLLMARNTRAKPRSRSRAPGRKFTISRVS